MLENDMTQYELAKLLGISQPSVSMMLKYELDEKEQKRIAWIINNQDKYREMTKVE